MIRQNEIQEIQHWIWKLVVDANMRGVTLGMSGGIDSAVVACLSAEALLIQDDLKVRAYALPILSLKSVDIAARHAAILQEAHPDTFSFGTVHLEKAFKSQVYDLGLHFKNTTPSKKKQLVEANLMARLRMSTLYALAQMDDHLVIGTENKTENKLGYFTKWGDGASDGEPIIEFLKTEVYEIAEYFVDRKLLSKEIVERPPSAELWTGQTDEGELGARYADIDKLLEWMGATSTYKKTHEIPVDNHTYSSICARIENNAHKHNVKHFERK